VIFVMLENNANAPGYSLGEKGKNGSDRAKQSKIRRKEAGSKRFDFMLDKYNFDLYNKVSKALGGGTQAEIMTMLLRLALGKPIKATALTDEDKARIAAAYIENMPDYLKSAATKSALNQ